MAIEIDQVSDGCKPYTADDALRDLASYVGAGGYNANAVDPATFFDKVKWGIDHLFSACEQDALRYRRLRRVGCAPGGSLHLEEGLVLVATNLDAYLDEWNARGTKPAPSIAVEYGSKFSQTLE